MNLRSLTTLLALVVTAAPLAAGESFAPLLNGRDLDGWKVPENNRWWLVEDGVLQVRSGPDQKGSVLWTEEDYENFVLELDFRLVSGTIDSGVHLRCQDQIQIGISGSLQRDMTASPYIPGKGYPVEAEGVAELLKKDGWNRLRIEVEGMDYTCHLNGEKVMTYTTDTGEPSGPIGLQLHGNRDMAIDFRRIRLAELD